jgi:hypothetical protein
MALPEAHAAALSDLRHKIERLGTMGAQRQTLAFPAVDHDAVAHGLH